MVNENDRFKRAPGIKSSINNIINGEFVKISDEFKPSYVIGLTGKQMARVNIIGIIVSDINNNESNADFTIDDSTGSLTVRTFDEKIIGKLSNVGTGSTVMIIGKPREFNDSIYLVPELIKELKDHNWIKLRKKELSSLEKGIPIKTPEPRAPITTEESFSEKEPSTENKIEDPVAMEGKSKYVESAGSEKETIAKETSSPEEDIEEESEKVDMSDFEKELTASVAAGSPEEDIEEESEETKEESVDIEQKPAENLNDPEKAVKTDFEPKENPFDKIVRIINELDEGRGADFEAVIEKSGLEKAEDVINNLLLEGEIFEISPGKLKVL